MDISWKVEAWTFIVDRTMLDFADRNNQVSTIVYLLFEAPPVADHTITNLELTDLSSRAQSGIITLARQ